jgi:hypothetical protein
MFKDNPTGLNLKIFRIVAKLCINICAANSRSLPLNFSKISSIDRPNFNSW